MTKAGQMVRAVPAAFRFAWSATRGYRLRPWRSPYLRWRMETYSGRPAEALTPAGMLQLLWKDRHQFVRFLHWIDEMQHRS